MPITSADKQNIEELLLYNDRNVPALVQLAKSITKNVCDIDSAQEALNYVCIHIEDTTALLNKRLITKEMLFRYLHRHKVPVTADFTKSTLITKVLNFWAERAPAPPPPLSSSPPTPAPSATNMLKNNGIANMFMQPPNTQTVCMPPPAAVALPTATSPIGTTTTAAVAMSEEQFPIHLFARQFTDWFFAQYNSSNLKLVDFWQDAHLTLRMASNDGNSMYDSSGAEAVIQMLMQSKQQFEFYFNPNVTHNGVQGRIDQYGLVLVLACGTLHVQQNCVGLFECTFGLLRDPYADNNWKVKRIQCLLRSTTTPQIPSLYNSETLQQALMLPAPMDELA